LLPVELGRQRDQFLVEVDGLVAVHDDRDAIGAAPEDCSAASAEGCERGGLEDEDAIA
jgi:hypothetical protein